jgi:hypothetical protein
MFLKLILFEILHTLTRGVIVDDLTIVTMKISIFWVITICSPTFRRRVVFAACFLLVTWFPCYLTLKIEAKFSTETLVHFNRDIWRCVPEARALSTLFLACPVPFLVEISLYKKCDGVFHCGQLFVARLHTGKPEAIAALH